MMYAARHHDLELLIEAPSRWAAGLVWMAEGRKLKIYGMPIVVEASRLTPEQRARCKVVS